MEFAITSQHMEEGAIEYVVQSNSIALLAPLNIVFYMKKITPYSSRITINIYYRKNILTKYGLEISLRLMMRMIDSISQQRFNSYMLKIE